MRDYLLYLYYHLIIFIKEYQIHNNILGVISAKITTPQMHKR